MKKPLRILVCGSRHWGNYNRIRAVISLLHNEQGIACVIHGCCPTGADMIADNVAITLGIPTKRYPADWKKHGKAAGPLRNQQMLDEGKPDLVLAFTNTPETSRGTKDMTTRAKKANLEVRSYTDHCLTNWLPQRKQPDV